MSKEIFGTIRKGDVVLVEYGDGTYSHDDNIFVQCGIVGMFLNKKDLADLFTILNYYINMENFTDCKIKIGDKDVAIQ